MRYVMSGKDLIVLESESASKLLYMIEFLLGQSHDRKETLRNLMSKHGDGFTVWQELKDRTKEIMEQK